MGSSLRLNSRIYTNSFSGKDKEMALPLVPKKYFGFQTKSQYSYNTYHALANNSPGFGSRSARWERSNGVSIAFNPPY
jgi:hypothetical protein